MREPHHIHLECHAAYTSCDAVSACLPTCPARRRACARSDLRTLRELTALLLSADPCAFLARCEDLRQGEGPRCVWLFHDAAHTLFEQVGKASHPGGGVWDQHARGVHPVLLCLSQGWGIYLLS